MKIVGQYGKLIYGDKHHKTSAAEYNQLLLENLLEVLIMKQPLHAEYLYCPLSVTKHQYSNVLYNRGIHLFHYKCT